MKGFAKDRITLYGHIADLKEETYRNLLVTLSLIQLLQEKGLVSLDELQTRAELLDRKGTPTLLNGCPPG